MQLGLLAAARITESAVVEPARELDDVELVAVAARDLDRARDAANRWDVPEAYGSYEALLASPAIDAVYIATPAGRHRRWTEAALAAGKHVLCEKPFANNAADAAAMVAAGEHAFATDGLILMEAFHWRYHPMVDQMRSILDSGQLGSIEHVEAHFDLPDGAIPRSDIRWDFALGGGATMDLGCYPAQWVRWAVGGEPEVVSATAEVPVEQIDGQLSAQLAWPSGVTGEISSSMIGGDDTPRIDLVVHGTKATMTAINPLAPQAGAELRVSTSEGTTDHPVAQTATYYHQLIAFRDAIATGTPPLTGGSDAIANMALIDACYAAAGLATRPGDGT